jgi:hypothetical protein
VEMEARALEQPALDHGRFVRRSTGPGRGSSGRPSSRRSTQRRRQRPTV